MPRRGQHIHTHRDWFACSTVAALRHLRQPHTYLPPTRLPKRLYGGQDRRERRYICGDWRVAHAHYAPAHRTALRCLRILPHHHTQQPHLPRRAAGTALARELSVVSGGRARCCVLPQLTPYTTHHRLPRPAPPLLGPADTTRPSPDISPSDGRGFAFYTGTSATADADYRHLFLPSPDRCCDLPRDLCASGQIPTWTTLPYGRWHGR